MALQNNLDIAIQDTNEELSQQKILQAYGNYDPKLTGHAWSANQEKRQYQARTNSRTETFNIRTITRPGISPFSRLSKRAEHFRRNGIQAGRQSNTTSSLFNPNYSATAIRPVHTAPVAKFQNRFHPRKHQDGQSGSQNHRQPVQAEGHRYHCEYPVSSIGIWYPQFAIMISSAIR